MNRSRLRTIARRLAAMAVIGLALLLQGCSCTELGKTCSQQANEHGVYVVHYFDVNNLAQTTTKETTLGGVLWVCDCLGISAIEKIDIVNDLAVSVSDTPDPVTLPSQTLMYRVFLRNLGTDFATGTNLEVTLPVSFNILNAGTLTCAPANGNIVCKNSVPFDVVNDYVAFELQVMPTAAGQFSITAKAFAIAVDSNPNNNVEVEETTVSPEVPGGADLSVNMAATQISGPGPGPKQLRFTIGVHNLGPNPANSVVLEGSRFFEGLDVPNIGTTVGSCTVNEGLHFRCDIGELSNGAKASVTVTAFPTVTGTLTKSVRVTSANDSNPLNDSATVQVTINPP